jgi:fatty-acyl-CoA synthase
MLGLKQVYCGRYVADSVLALFQREKVTSSHCVPTILRMLLDSAKAKGINLSGWKMLIGGAILAQALAREALELGLDVYAGYGMSETCPCLTLSGLMRKMTGWDFERQVEMRCKAGRPIPLAQIRIVDGEMNDLKISDSAGWFGLLLLLFRERLFSDSFWHHMEVISPVQDRLLCGPAQLTWR